MPRIVLHPHPSRARRGGRAGGGGGTGGAFGTGSPLEQTGYHANLEHAALVASSQLRAQQGAEDARAHAHIEQVHRNRALLAELEATDPDLKSDPRYGYLRGVADTGGDLSHAVQFVSHERDQRAAAEERAKAKENARAEQGNRSHLLLDGLEKEDPQFAASREAAMFRFMADNGADVGPGVRSWYAAQERAAARMKAVAPSVPDDEAAAILVRADPKLDPQRALGIVQAQRAGITGKFHVSEAGAGAKAAHDPLLPNVTDTELSKRLKETSTASLTDREKARTALRARGLDDNGNPLNVPPGAPAGFVGRGRLMQEGDKGYDPRAAAGGFVNARDDYGRPWQLGMEEAARHGLVPMAAERTGASGPAGPRAAAPTSPGSPAQPAAGSPAGLPSQPSPPPPAAATPAGPPTIPGNALSSPQATAPAAAPPAPPAPQAQAGPAQPSPYAPAHAALDRFAQLHGRPADTQNPQDRAALKALLAPLLGAPPAPPATQAAQPPLRPQDQDPYAEGR